MKMTSLIVNTPEGYSGRVLTSAEDFVFRYDAQALPSEVISLMDVRFAKSICKVRKDEQKSPTLGRASS